MTTSIGELLTELDGSLAGPRKWRVDLLTELRDSLCDNASAYSSAGMAPDVAEAKVVDEFGPCADAAALYQRELVAVQGRRTALLVAVGFPAFVVLWGGLWATVWRGIGHASPASSWLSGSYGWVAGAAAVGAVTGWVVLRGRLAPRHATTLISVVGAVALVLTLGVTAVRYVVGRAQVAALFAGSPLAVPVHVASFVLASLVARSVWRSYRLSRVGLSR
jgi:biotin transporter BioY